MSWFSPGYRGQRCCSWARMHDDDDGVAQHGGHTPNKRCWFFDWIAGSCLVNLLKTGQDCSEAG